VAAETAGFDDAWIAEHHFMSYGTCPSAITFAAHALGHTSRIGIGTAVSVLSTTHPVALVEQDDLLDQLSDGRLHLRVGHLDPQGVHHVSTVLTHVADSRDQAVAAVRESMLGWLAEELAGYEPIDGRARPRRDHRRYTNLQCDLHPVGTPEACVARLRASAERTGIRHVIMLVEGAGSRAATLANIARLGTEALRRLRE